MIFDSIALRLQNMLSESEYSRYIKQMSYDEKASKSDLAVFEVPNPFIASWIKTKYCDKIADLFQLESSQGIRPTIEIRLKSAKKRGRKKSETIITLKVLF